MMLLLAASTLLLAHVASASLIGYQHYAAPPLLPYPYANFRSYPSNGALVQDTRYNDGGFAYSTQEFHGPLSPYIQNLHRRLTIGYTVPTLSPFGYLQAQPTFLLPQSIYRPETFPSFYPVGSNEINPSSPPEQTVTPATEQTKPVISTEPQPFPPAQFPLEPSAQIPVQIPIFPPQQPQFPLPPQLPQQELPTQPPLQEFPTQPPLQEFPTQSPPTIPAGQPTQQLFGDSFSNGNSGDKGLNDEDTISVDAA